LHSSLEQPLLKGSLEVPDGKTTFRDRIAAGSDVPRNRGLLPREFRAISQAVCFAILIDTHRSIGEF
jgi:hypothetical protein